MAGSRSLGVLTLDLVTKLGGFVSGMNAAERQTDKTMRAIQNKASALGKTLGVSLGLSISGALAGGVAALNNAIDTMDKMRDASIRLGIGVETLSAFGYAAQQTGTDIDSLGKGLKILAKNMADALNPDSGKSQVFEALGIQVADATGKLKTFEQIIPEIADKFAMLEDGTTKAALAQELFGKSGLELVEFLNQGGAGIEELTDKARELGLVFDQEAADKADQFNDTLADLKGALMGVALQVANDLLPDLLELSQWAVGFVKEGNDAGGAAHEIANGFRDIAAVARSFGEVIDFLEGVRSKVNDVQQAMVDGNWITEARKQFQEQIWGRSGEWDLRGFVDKPAQRRTGPLPSTGIEDMFQVPGLTPTARFDATAGQFNATQGTGLNRKALNDALSGTKPDKGGGAKKGKSDAEKQAEALKKAIEAMTEAQREWQAELDGTGNKIADDYAKRLAEITRQAEEFTKDGIPADKVAAFRTEMEGLALAIKDKETAQYLQDFADETENLIAQANGVSTATQDYTKAIRELDKELAAGAIGQDAYADRAEALAQVRDAAANQVLRDIQTQQDMLGQTAEYQDTYNKLAYAGVDANSALGQSIIEANAALHEQAQLVADQVELMDEFRSGLGDAFVDFVTGAKSAKDAFRDFFDDMAAKLLRMIAEKWIERAFGQMGTTGNGTAGGNAWSSIFSGMFGSGSAGAATGGGASGWEGALTAIFGAAAGGRAGGGSIRAWTPYRVNEAGLEMASIAGRDYLLSSESGVVHSAADTQRRIGGGGGFGPITIQVQGRPTKATAKQMGRELQVAQQREVARTGGFK